MEVVPLTQELRDGYAALVSEIPGALFYHAPGFLGFLCKLLGAEDRSLVARDRGNRVVGVMPLLAKLGRFGAVLNSLPFYGSNGGIVTRDAEARGLLTRSYNQQARDPSVASATVVVNPLDDETPAGIAHNQTDSRIGQFTPLRFPDAHAERILAQCHYKTRNMIRKAQKSAVEVSVSNEQVEFLEATHCENLAALGGTPKPAMFFELFPRHFAENREYRIYAARRDGALVAALLLFYFNRTVEYYMPVIRKEFRDLQPMSLLVFTAMCDAAREGYWWWNWGGTWHTQDGVYRFKSRWGTVERNYTYFVQLNRQDIASHDRQAILDAYPYFYVLPFGMLAPRPRPE